MSEEKTVIKATKKQLNEIVNAMKDSLNKGESVKSVVEDAVKSLKSYQKPLKVKRRKLVKTTKVEEKENVQGISPSQMLTNLQQKEDASGKMLDVDIDENDLKLLKKFSISSKKGGKLNKNDLKKMRGSGLFSAIASLFG